MILTNTILQGHVLEVLKRLPDESVNCCVTSPPYFGEEEKFINMVGITNDMRDKLGRFVKGFRAHPKTEFKKGQHWRQKQAHWEKKWLHNEYVVLNKSAHQIAQEQQCTENNILYWLHKHKVKARQMSEIRSKKYWGAVGEKNPMYGKRGKDVPSWQGGITPERQAFYVSVEWKRACSFVWKRDNATCQRCTSHHYTVSGMHVHHISGFKDKINRANTNNLLLLCEYCHRFIHSKKNVRKEFLRGGGGNGGTGT